MTIDQVLTAGGESALARIVQAVCLAWLLAEVLVVAYTRRNSLRAWPRDRGSRTLLWCAVGVGLAVGTAVQAVPLGRIRMPESWRMGVCLGLLVAGLGIRGAAILTLGRYFTTRVAVHEGQPVVRKGPYRWVRHPSYSGLILLFLGMALSFGNWISFAVIVGPFLAALLYRIEVEESSLREALGPAYVEYSRATKRLVPGLY